MKTIIAGSRKNINKAHLLEALRKIDWKITEVVCGMADGADTVGKAWAEENNIPVKEFPADWKNLSHPVCKIKRKQDGSLINVLSGFNRNLDMAYYADALIALRLPMNQRSNGTDHMIEEATKKGLKVFVYVIPD
jgi:hypothetical protein